MALIRLRTGSRLEYGHNAYIAKGSDVYIPERGEIGSNVSIGANFFSQTNFFIGDECLISSNVSFVGNDHDLYGGRSAYFSGRLPASTVTLEGDVFIGFGATLVGNVRIGRGAIVAAGALVVGDVAPGDVVAGVPAKRIKSRLDRRD